MVAPVNGNASLLLTVASTAMSVVGGFGASQAQSSLDSDTKTIMKEVEGCISKIKEDQIELRAYVQEFDGLMNYFREHGARTIITFAEKRECGLKGKDNAEALALDKSLLDSFSLKERVTSIYSSTLRRYNELIRYEIPFNPVRNSGCTSVARFLCVLQSNGPETVLTIRSWLRKCMFILTYGPNVIISRATLQHFLPQQMFASFAPVINTATTGIQDAKVMGKMRNLLHKSQFILKYVLDAILPRASSQESLQQQIMFSFSKVATSGNTAVKLTRLSTMSKDIVRRAKTVGRNIIGKLKNLIVRNEQMSKRTVVKKTVVRNKQMSTRTVVMNAVLRNEQTSTDTVVENAESVSKVGLGLCVFSIAVNTYYIVKAEEESKKHHPEYNNVLHQAEQLRLWSRDVQAQLDGLESIYDEMRSLHIVLIAFLEAMNDHDEVEDILTYIEKSANALWT